MFISKRKYELDTREAEERGRYEGREEVWKEQRMRELSDEVEKLKREVALLKDLNKGSNEGSSGEKNPAGFPLTY